jgi:hypothetical protein
VRPVEQRPPPVTIEGGSGWQLDGGARETLEAQPTPTAAPSGRGRRLASLALAAAVGFGAASVLAEQRQRARDDSPEGVLALDVALQGADDGGSLVTTNDGALAVTTSVVLRNTGPLPVTLDGAELLGTQFRSDDLAGRRMAAEGGQSVVVLARPVDCDALGGTPPSGRLRVRARTEAGTRTVELRVPSQGVSVADEVARSACGLSPPEQALVVMDSAPFVRDGRATVTVELSNASATALLVDDVRPQDGLRLLGLRDATTGEPLPLVLPAGDFDPPVDAFQGRGPSRTLVAVLEVADCSRVERTEQDVYSPLLQATVRANGSLRRATTAWGGDPSVVDRLRRASCPQLVGSLAEDPPVLSEQAMHALRRDHPFLTPD